MIILLGNSINANLLVANSVQTSIRGSSSRHSKLQHHKRVVACSNCHNEGVVTGNEADANNKKGDLLHPFHLAFPTHSIVASREFYLGEGRSSSTWVDFDLYGHQIVCHYIEGYDAKTISNPVDGDDVPVPHFGLAMSVSAFQTLAERVRNAGVEFEIKPHLRFEGQPGEQYTMFFRDPSGNPLEFKAMTNPNNLFAKYVVE